MKKQILKILLPFVEKDGAKSRPVLQISNPSDEHNNFQVGYITSKKPESQFFTDLEISSNHPEFALTGLVKSSYVRISKIFTIDPTFVDSVIGDLPSDLSSEIDKILSKHFSN